MRYCVGFVSLFDNVMEMEIVEANSPIEALFVHTKVSQFSLPNMTIEQVIDSLFGADVIAGVIEVPNA